MTNTTVVYFDTQDPNNLGWAYRTWDADGVEQSGGLDTIDPEGSQAAADEAQEMFPERFVQVSNIA